MIDQPEGSLPAANQANGDGYLSADNLLTLTTAARGLGRRKLIEKLGVAGCILALIVAILPLAHILVTAAMIGGSKISWTFFSQPAGGLPYIGSQGGVENGLTGTIILLAIGGLVAVPIGVGGGMFLADFGDGQIGGFIRTCGDTLLGVPSVIWGLFGYLVFTNPLSSFGTRWGFSALAGGAILGLVMTPIIARVVELSLRDVPRSYHEASLSLGATKWATMRRIGMRVAWPGMLTGVLLALSNALGQTVALLLTNGYTYFMPHWPLWGQNDNVTDLGSLIYLYLNQPSPVLQPPAEAAVIVLLCLVLALSLLSRALVALARRSYAA